MPSVWDTYIYMRYYGYRIVLGALRMFVYLKRGASWLGKYLVVGLKKIDAVYEKTLGFYLYKAFFVIKKKWFTYRGLVGGQVLDFIGKRGTLQAILFVVVLLIMIPHSVLYTKERKGVPGRNTILYSLIIDENDVFATQEEEYTDVATPAFIANNVPVWKQGVVGADNPVLIGTDVSIRPQDVTGLSAGGSAITKPTILPGNSLSSGSLTQTSNRTEAVYYEVQPGDVIGAIADQYGVTLETILWANNLTERSYIRPGDTLKILPTSGVEHKVKSGDTISRIARLYNADADTIIDFNHLQEDGADIIIGEELMIPGGVKVQTTKAIASSQVRPASPLKNVVPPPPSVNAPAGSGFIWPSTVRYISQYFGIRHNAVDIAGAQGSPLYAAKAGTVIKSQCGYNYGYGCHVIIDHGNGIHTLYGHAKEGSLYVVVGDVVEQGQTIALMGSTGNSSGPHVHFEVRVNGKQQNPLGYIR